MAAEALTWIDSTSTSHALDGSTSPKVWALDKRSGFYMPPTAQLVQRVPLQPGAIQRYTDIQPRIVTVPLLINANGNETNLRTQLRNMVDIWFANPGVLRATAPGGDQRDLNAYYLAGLDLTEDQDQGYRGNGWVYAVAQFEATDPFWYDTADTTAGTFSNAQMLAGQTITNNGTYPVYAKWDMRGPHTNMVVTNTTTGLALKMTASGGYTDPTSTHLVIDCKAGTVVQGIGSPVNVIQYLSTDSIFFPLVPGANAITWTYTGGDSVNTQCTVTYRQRYRSV